MCRITAKFFDGLAVNRNEFTACPIRQRLYPRDKTGVERDCVQCTQDPPKCIGARNATWQLQESLEPVVLGDPKFRHILPAFAHANHREQGKNKNVHQRMNSSALDAWVRHFFKETKDPQMSSLHVAHGRKTTSPCFRQHFLPDGKGRCYKIGTNPHGGHKLLSDGAPALKRVASYPSCSMSSRAS